MSIHIKNDAHFAKTVLMPGDPLRAKFMADQYLVDYEEVTNIRGILGFTGKTKDGKEVSIMASGMGCPSIGIYSHELYTMYGVEQIIRVGTAGSINKEIHVGDLVLGTSACSNSGFSKQFTLKGIEISPVCNFDLLYNAFNNAKEMGLKTFVGPIFSSDVFYDEDEKSTNYLSSFGVLCCEMEAYALYMTAMRLNKKALAILTISDSLVNKERELTSEERQNKLDKMFKLALTLA